MNSSVEKSSQPTYAAIDEFLAEGSAGLGMGKEEETATDEADALANYSLEGLNLHGNVPLERVVAAVRKFRRGEFRPGLDRPRLNILLSGVPGGGKTAFVRYLAHEVGAPLHTVRASDLLSKWIGENEQNLAKAFKTAKEKNAILFLDEVDSFLQERGRSSRSWEVTSVNELLQQMENFGGIMIGATNFSDSLDKAVLRRFTFKLELDYLTDEGKRIFFRRYFGDELTEPEALRLQAIDQLAPGDFRTVSEELFYLCDEETNEARLEALERESAAKGCGRAKIGF